MTKQVVMATGGQTLTSRRRNSQYLTPLYIPRLENASDVETDPFDLSDGRSETDEDVVEEGRQLFNNFIYHRVKSERKKVEDINTVLTPAGYANPMWAKTGRELRIMADEFARTSERQRVKQKANQVNTDIVYEEFRDLLSELFPAGGITRERIVVLFFFCSDVAIRSLQRGVELFSRIVEWSLTFITEFVCSWVRSHGGWVSPDADHGPQQPCVSMDAVWEAVLCHHNQVMTSTLKTLPRYILLASVICLGVGILRYVSR